MKFTSTLAILSLALSVSASGGGGGAPDLCKNVPVCNAGRRRSLGLTTLPRAWINAARGIPTVEVGLDAPKVERGFGIMEVDGMEEVE